MIYHVFHNSSGTALFDEQQGRYFWRGNVIMLINVRKNYTSLGRQRIRHFSGSVWHYLCMIRHSFDTTRHFVGSIRYFVGSIRYYLRTIRHYPALSGTGR